MSLPKERIYYLLESYISKRATTLEEDELMAWILEAEEDSELKNYMLDIWSQHLSTKDLSYVDWNEIYSRVRQQQDVAHGSKVRKIKWLRLTAAAAILAVLVAGAYLWLKPPAPQRVANRKAKLNRSDIAPPSANKAILTLADGTEIKIDSTANGTIALQGNVRIIKQSNGKISYTGSAAEEVSYNTLNVPRGSRPMSLVLSDGSQVWLNVGSSLTYPTAFTGKERKVKITGEAYFEVAHNASMPFIVQYNDVTVNVLGTHFNVNAYADEADQRVTLLEGSVRINRSSFSEILKPGQQARVSNNEVSDIKVVNDVDIDKVMAWKNGKFMFEGNTDINTIMRQISRWYNVDIVYEGKVSQRFWGSISRDVNVSQVLKILEATGGVNFEVERDKITVMPALP